jgi:predicted nucleotidyltransferase
MSTIILKVEVGSRNWGYANESSDYDTKSVSLPDKNLYYSKFEGVGKIAENTDNINIAFYLDHFMGVVSASNQMPFEMVRSTIIYQNDLFENIPELLTHFCPQKLYYQYLGFGLTRLQTPSNIKSLLHSTRALLTAKVLLENTLPETNIIKLLNQVSTLDSDIVALAQELVVNRKFSKPEYEERFRSSLAANFVAMRNIDKKAIPQQKNLKEHENFCVYLEEITLKVKLKYYG